MTGRRDFLRISCPGLVSTLALQAARSEAPAATLRVLHLDTHSHRITAEPDEYAARPVAVGSLLKPFVALAAQEHRRYAPLPTVRCTGLDSGCWLPVGHGSTDLVSAISYSCNTYFRELSRSMPATSIEAVCHRFGLTPPDDYLPDTLTGFGRRWPQRPIDVIRAFAQLLELGPMPGAPEIRAGMRAAAGKGTAKAFAAAGLPAALAKTGTAPCSDEPRASADGFAFVALPADTPRDLYLFSLHGRTGRETAQAGARWLTARSQS